MRISRCRSSTIPEIVNQGSPRVSEFKQAFENEPDPKWIDRYIEIFTESGLRRVEKLRNLEGLRFKRGFLGNWGSAEGLVFDDFFPETHIIDNFTISSRWLRYMSVDWGFRNPASVIWWARSPDDRLYAYKEIYKPKLTKPELIALIQKYCDPTDKIRHVAVDSADQDGVRQLQNAGFRVNEPKKDRVAQIDSVKERLKVDANGEPGIYFLRDRLVHAPDADLQDAYRSTEVTDEFASLEYAEKLRGTRKDDEETVGDNHGVDGTSYLVQSLLRGRGIGSGNVIHGSVQMRR